jgi:hypothetical protein
VTIKAYQATRADGTTRYEYRVENGGPNRIVGFAIGDDYYHGVSELRVSPQEWVFDKGLAAETVTSPPAWHATLITTEESPSMQLEWRNDGSADILSRKTVTGFSVVTPEQDSHYLTGHWTAFLSDSTIESATLVPGAHF